jgi:hypothetical protein
LIDLGANASRVPLWFWHNGPYFLGQREDCVPISSDR